MPMLRTIEHYFCTAVTVINLLNLAHSAVFIRFDQAPKAASRFTNAIFKYSVLSTDGSYPCKQNACSFYCQLDGRALKPCPADAIVLRNLTANRHHRFRVKVTTKDGEKNSTSYPWVVDTKPPTATISSEQSYTNGKKVTINVTFTEACTGKGGFKCENSSNCDVMVSGPAHVDATSLRILDLGIKYSLDIILSPVSVNAYIDIKMSNMLCTDLAGNQFTRTNGSNFIVHLDRRPVQVDFWTSVPSYELEIDGVLRTVTATNRMEQLKIFLDFSNPVINSTNEIINAFHLNSGVLIPIHSSSHGNRKFVFQLKNVLRTEIIKVELLAASVISRTGAPISPVAPITFLYEPNVMLRTSSPRVTKESYINVVIEFTKPVLDFEASKVDIVGGSLTRFKQLSRALYSLTIMGESQNVTVIVPAGKVHDISGNINLVSNQLEVKHRSSPAISIALHSFISMGILATSLASAGLSLSSANLEAIDALGSTNMVFSDSSMNLRGMVGHLQVFVLSDWFSDALPAEYTATTKGLRWLIPHAKLPWKRASSASWPNHLYVAETSAEVKGIGFPIQIYPHGQQMHIATKKSTSYGLPLDSKEYLTYLLRGEPLPASSTIKKLEHYNGWQESEMNLFWLGVGGGGLLLIHILTFLFVRWRTQMTGHGILSVPSPRRSSSEVDLKHSLTVHCIVVILDMSSGNLIAGGTACGILTGALLLAIPAALVLSVCLFLTVAIFSGSFFQYKEIKYMYVEEKWYTKLWQLLLGKPTIGKWFYRDGLHSSFLSLFGILFENQKGPPHFVFIDENAPNNMPKWIESGQTGIGRLRAVRPEDSNELAEAPLAPRLLGCVRSSYVILDLMRRVCLGILAGTEPSRGRSQCIIALTITLTQLLYLVTLKPYIRREVHVAESVCLICEAGIFGLSIGINQSGAIEGNSLGYLMLALLVLAFVAQIINEWYNMIECLLKFSQPHQNSFKFGLKYATKGLVLALLPRRYWSRIIPGSSHQRTGLAPVSPLSPGIESERGDARPRGVDTWTAMTRTVVPLPMSPGSPDLSTTQQTASKTAETAHQRQKIEGGKRLIKGLKLESNNEMKRLRELARASFSGGTKCEEGSTSYGFNA